MNKNIVIEVITEECVGKWCAICVKECPTEAIVINDVVQIDKEKCIKCEKCAKNICPNYAIIIKEI